MKNKLIIPSLLFLTFFPASGARSETIFEETFETYKIGQAIGDETSGTWRSNGNAKTEQPGSAKAVDGRNGSIAASTLPATDQPGKPSTALNLYTPFPAITGKARVALDVLVQRGGAQVILFSSSGGGGDYALKIVFRPAPDLVIQATHLSNNSPSTTEVAGYRPGRWYRLTLSVDLTGKPQTYAIDVTDLQDDSVVGSLANLSLVSNQPDLGRIAFGSIYSSQAKALWDNIQIETEK
jgi:hypothetical protein